MDELLGAIDCDIGADAARRVLRPSAPIVIAT
jgi:hypothetical protein